MNAKLGKPIYDLFSTHIYPIYSSLLLSLLLSQKVHGTDTMVVETKLWRFQSYLLIISIWSANLHRPLWGGFRLFLACSTAVADGVRIKSSKSVKTSCVTFARVAYALANWYREDLPGWIISPDKWAANFLWMLLDRISPLYLHQL